MGFDVPVNGIRPKSAWLSIVILDYGIANFLSWPCASTTCRLALLDKFSSGWGGTLFVGHDTTPSETGGTSCVKSIVALAHCHRHRGQVSILVVPRFYPNHQQAPLNGYSRGFGRTEKGVRQDYTINFRHGRIIHEVRIDEEENRHIDGLPCIQSLLFEAEALDLAEVRSHLCWSDTVRGNPYYIFRALICRCEESQCSLSRKYSDLSLLGCELPRHHV